MTDYRKARQLGDYANFPAFEWELSCRDFDVTIGCDEVGRGSQVGPIAICLAVLLCDKFTYQFSDQNIAKIPDQCSEAFPNNACPPVGLRDSKLLSRKAREKLVEPILSYLTYSTICYASPQEIRCLGITSAVRTAALRGMLRVDRYFAQTRPGVTRAACLIDGSYNWFGRFTTSLEMPNLHVEHITTQVKADRTSVLVASASVLAKVYRDRLMTSLSVAFPQYGWHRNAGYPTKLHREMVEKFGPTPFCRKRSSQ